MKRINKKVIISSESEVCKFNTSLVCRNVQYLHCELGILWQMPFSNSTKVVFSQTEQAEQASEEILATTSQLAAFYVSKSFTLLV